MNVTTTTGDNLKESKFQIFKLVISSIFGLGWHEMIVFIGCFLSCVDLNAYRTCAIPRPTGCRYKGREGSIMNNQVERRGEIVHSDRLWRRWINGQSSPPLLLLKIAVLMCWSKLWGGKLCWNRCYSGYLSLVSQCKCRSCNQSLLACAEEQEFLQRTKEFFYGYS